ncbi:hypothetical protein Cs7R123_31830 [Catellatospora sp. TT07R-123]|nr:hypothetical protein Cs7R123_31830 [Catellatospora sp. TT07R-123]
MAWSRPIPIVVAARTGRLAIPADELGGGRAGRCHDGRDNRSLVLPGGHQNGRAEYTQDADEAEQGIR